MKSIIGTNLIEVTYSDPSQCFLNILKTANIWAGNTSAGPRYTWEGMQLDANGYPTSFTGIGVAAGKTFTEIDTLVNRSLGINNGASAPFYPAGNYVFLYGGGGGSESFAFQFDANTTATGAGGRIIVPVPSPSANGVRIQINNLGSPTVNNFAFIYSPDSTSSHIGTNEAAYNAGAIFNPDFVSRITPFTAVRFMKWLNTVNNSEINWSDKTPPTYCFWTPGAIPGVGPQGAAVPWEVCVALANQLGLSAAWINMPMMSTDAYVSSLRSLVKNGATDSGGRVWSGLNSTIKLYVEYGNEIWNNGAIASNVYYGTATLGYTANPGQKSVACTVTASVSGTTMTVTAISAGFIYTQDGSSTHQAGNSWWDSGGTITQSGVAAVTQLSGTPGGVGTYQLSQSLSIGSQTFTQGIDFSSVFNYGLLRAVQNNASFRSVFGTQVVRVVAGQTGYTGRNQFILSQTAADLGGNPANFTGTVAQNVDVFAGAPYFGYPTPDTWTLDQLFNEILFGGWSGGYPGGMVQQAIDFATAPINGDAAVAQAYNVGYVCYEGGQTLVDYSHSDAALQALYYAANTDARMGVAYDKLLNAVTQYASLFMNFTLCSGYNQYGYWGELQNIDQTSTPRYDALLNFIARNSQVTPGSRPVFLTKL